METYLTIAELAEYIKVSEQTVRRHVLNRTAPCHKIGKVVRFRVSEIEKWIDAGGLTGAISAGTKEGCQKDLFGDAKAEVSGTGGGTGDPEGSGANEKTGEEQA